MNPINFNDNILRKDLAKVEDLLYKNLQSMVPLVPKLGGYLLSSGGKRLRAMLTIVAARAINPDPGESTFFLAAAVELIHSATLLHDDVIDESNLRRGQNCAHLIWGSKASILVGDFLFAKAFELMVRTNDFEILGILAKTAATISEGEVLQLTHGYDFSISVVQIQTIIEAKTAALFSAACKTGALSAGANHDLAVLMGDLGYYLGMIFQIRDDIADYLNPLRGKAAGDDFKEGKITLPLLLAYQNAELHVQQEIKQALNDTFYDENWPNILKKINENGGFVLAQNMIEQYHRLAQQVLEKIPSNEAKDFLQKMLDEYAMPCCDTLLQRVS